MTLYQTSITTGRTTGDGGGCFTKIYNVVVVDVEGLEVPDIVVIV